MDRRTFVKTGAWLTAAGGVWPWFADPGEERRAIAIFDPALAASRAFADDAARAGMLAIDIRDDIGELWYATLAPRLARASAPLVGVLRASDFFVLKQLAAGAGHVVRHAAQESAGRAMAIAFVIDCASPFTRHEG
jgi:hypothetical protein